MHYINARFLLMTDMETFVNDVYEYVCVVFKTVQMCAMMQNYICGCHIGCVI